VFVKTYLPDPKKPKIVTATFILTHRPLAELEEQDAEREKRAKDKKKKQDDDKKKETGRLNRGASKSLLHENESVVDGTTLDQDAAPKDKCTT